MHLAHVLAHALRALPADVDPGLLHHAHGQWVDRAEGPTPRCEASKRSPPCLRKKASAIWLRAELPVHRKSTRVFFALARAGQRLRKALDKGADFVPNAAVMPQRLLFGPGVLGQARRIVEADVHHLRPAREDRAALVRVVANGHDVVEWHGRHFGNGLRALARDVHARLGHHLHGARVRDRAPRCRPSTARSRRPSSAAPSLRPSGCGRNCPCREIRP